MSERELSWRLHSADSSPCVSRPRAFNRIVAERHSLTSGAPKHQRLATRFLLDRLSRTWTVVPGPAMPARCSTWLFIMRKQPDDAA
jgi:hypothetical protein